LIKSVKSVGRVYFYNTDEETTTGERIGAGFATAVGF
jgi:hypothetical protein